MGEMPALLSYFHVSEEKGSEAVGEFRFSWLSEVELWRRCIGDLLLFPAAAETPASRSMPSGSTIATGKDDEDDAVAPPLTAAPHNLMESGADAIRVTF
jgi:hypothetical protein